MISSSLLLTAAGLEKLKDKKIKKAATMGASDRFSSSLASQPYLSGGLDASASADLPVSLRGHIQRDIGPGLLTAHTHTCQLCRRQLEEKEV